MRSLCRTCMDMTTDLYPAIGGCGQFAICHCSQILIRRAWSGHWKHMKNMTKPRTIGGPAFEYWRFCKRPAWYGDKVGRDIPARSTHVCASVEGESEIGVAMASSKYYSSRVHADSGTIHQGRTRHRMESVKWHGRHKAKVTSGWEEKFRAAERRDNTP